MRNIKWVTADNYDASRILKQHGFIRSYNDNISVCGKIQLRDDYESSLLFSQIKDEGLNEEKACKTCLKLFKL